jgi:hypothetical protein
MRFDKSMMLQVLINKGGRIRTLKRALCRSKMVFTAGTTFSTVIVCMASVRVFFGLLRA